ncbi:hypothetical protein F383_22543 [Gossypium arboreum]|uniref:Uncharacterized protein n=1 Tax=Gossypium arboreum TaxID=29729 RepID=A0A0B0MGV4_GOSAR|nr:hypothetical protein F383_22543 [Gossypium arboreum]
MSRHYDIIICLPMLRQGVLHVKTKTLFLVNFDLIGTYFRSSQTVRSFGAYMYI